jgi:hypothetical protein
MSNDTNHLDILYKELDGLRQMQRGLQSSIHQAVFAFALATGGVAAAYPAIKEDMRPTALFALTQIEFALGMLVLGLLAHHNVATGCSIAIESKINGLAKSNVAIFEGHLAARFYRTSNGAFWFAKYTMFWFLACLFLVVAYNAAKDSLLKPIVVPVILLEFISIVYILARTTGEGRQSQDITAALLENQPDPGAARLHGPPTYWGICPIRPVQWPMWR